MGTLMPRLTNQTFAGHDVTYPTIMPICMGSQSAAELGMRWCGAENGTKAMMREYSATANGPKYSAVIGKTKSITPFG